MTSVVRGPTGKFSHAWPARNLSAALTKAMLNIFKAVWVMLNKKINLTFYMAT
jgi:hypothetical protein